MKGVKDAPYPLAPGIQIQPCSWQHTSTTAQQKEKACLVHPLSHPQKDQDGLVNPEGKRETQRLRSSLCKQGSWIGCISDFIPGQGCHKKEKYSVIIISHCCKRLKIRAQKAWVPATFCFDRTLKCLLESSQREKFLR